MHTTTRPAARTSNQRPKPDGPAVAEVGAASGVADKTRGAGTELCAGGAEGCALGEFDVAPMGGGVECVAGGRADGVAIGGGGADGAAIGGGGEDGAAIGGGGADGGASGGGAAEGDANGGGGIDGARTGSEYAALGMGGGMESRESSACDSDSASVG